jgi:hypothetical protein
MELYSPTLEELAFIEHSTQSTVAAFDGIILLKTTPRLGYFPSFDAQPSRLIRPFATVLSVLSPHDTPQLYEQRGVRKWHPPLIRAYLGLPAFSDGGRRILVGARIDASKSKDILADIINVVNNTHWHRLPPTLSPTEGTTQETMNGPGNLHSDWQQRLDDVG